VTLPRRLWLWLLLAGAVVWALAVAITALTQDTILAPTVILVGSFLVPVATVAFGLSRAEPGALEPAALMLGFLIAGTLGVVLSAVVEIYLLPTNVGTFAGVGLIEEATKGVVVLAVAPLVTTRDPRHGLILGATVGAGFASFESAGYALTAVIGHADDHPIRRIVETEACRALLAPVGHITWTALLGGALFAGGRRTVLGTLAGVIALHGMWDASYGVAIMITQGVVGDGWDLAWPNTEAWIGAPTGHTLVVFQLAYDGLLAVLGAIGGVWLARRWRAGARSAVAAG
jgi:protease PrsW